MPRGLGVGRARLDQFLGQDHRVHPVEGRPRSVRLRDLDRGEPRGLHQPGIDQAGDPLLVDRRPHTFGLAWREPQLEALVGYAIRLRVDPAEAERLEHGVLVRERARAAHLLVDHEPYAAVAAVVAREPAAPRGPILHVDQLGLGHALLSPPDDGFRYHSTVSDRDQRVRTPSNRKVSIGPFPLISTVPRVRSENDPASTDAARAVSWISPGRPCDSMRLAVFTVSPHRS